MRKMKRVNARLTDEVERQLQEIVRATGSTMSEVIMKAIEVYYYRGHASQRPYEIVKRSGLIGCGEASENLSRIYKKDFLKTMSRKHGYR